MKTNKIALLGLLISFAFILSYIEAILPPIIPIPGCKIGLSNLVILTCLMHLSKKEAFLVLLGKLILSSFFLAQGMSFLYSFAGGISSFLIMLLFITLLHKKYVFIISIFGAITHNFAQLTIAFFLIQVPSIFYYAPILFLSGLVTGFLIFLIYHFLIPRLPNFWYK